ncbi:MAG: gamma-glutamylcyclotransferase family protein [Pseudomonadota bacterium]
MTQHTGLLMDTASITDELLELAHRGELIAYFGYGSLVNPFTHRTDILTYQKATLKGWRRTWQARPDMHPDPIALLSSSPGAAADRLSGLLVFDRFQNLPDLDAREAGYTRHKLPHDAVEMDFDVPAECPIYVYEGQAPAQPDRQHAILQSYLDAVLQGYFLMYGEQGVREFLTTTGAFDTPILRDRGDPRYPRHVSLDPAQRTLIDDVIFDLTFIDQF